MNKEEFYNQLKELNIEINEDQKRCLSLFCDLLLEYNKHTNLTAIKDPEGVYLKHFYDSLTITKSINLSNQSLLDIGSGAGFPGLVLKIMYPNLKITSLDSNHKKTDFQKYIVEKLNLKDFIIINDRAENYFKKVKDFDIVTARAVASLNILSEISIPFVKQNGYFIALKGDANEELSLSEYAIEFLGGKIKDIIKFNLPKENSARTIIKVEKIKNTPVGYPRSYDKILKKPLKRKEK